MGACAGATVYERHHPRDSGRRSQYARLEVAKGILCGASIIREIKASRIEFVASVPDITTSEGLLRRLARKPGAAPHLSDLNIFEQQAGAVLAEQGSVFAGLKIVSSGPRERHYTSLHGAHVRKAFKDAVAA
jgi:hypothetical protein